MPNRILHERTCTSETMAELTGDEERFFFRLMVQCDDYGRFDGRPSVVRARCFPLQLDSISESDVTGWLQRMVDVGLIQPYTVDGRQYIQVVTWERHQQIRAKASKYPDPLSNVSNGNHPISDASEREQIPSYSRSDIREARSENSAAAASAVPPKDPPEPIPKPNRVAEFVDAVKAIDESVPVNITGRDGKAMKDTNAKPSDLARAYVAAFRGDWDPAGNGWLQGNLSLHNVIDRIAGFEAHLRAPPKPRNGQTAVSTGNDVEAARRRYATTIAGGPAG